MWIILIDWLMFNIKWELTIILYYIKGTVVIVIVWQLDLQLSVQSVPITTKVMSSNPVHCEVFSIQHYVIKFVSYLRLTDHCDCLNHKYDYHTLWSINLCGLYWLIDWCLTSNENSVIFINSRVTTILG
jgi:hypothetical protein